MAENIEEDKASWAEVQVTFILTVGTSAIFLGIFEIARRSPVISSVFDRRRNSKPHRTPPPLLSTSIFEWLFLSSEPRYSEYSDLSHMRDVIQERRRQRNPGRSGFFSSGRGNRDDDGPSSDLDSPRDTVDPRDTTFDTMHALGGVAVNPFGVEVTNNSNHTSGSSPNKMLKIQRYLTPDVVEVSGRRLPKEVAEYALANDLSEEQLDEYEAALVEQEKQDEMEFHRRVKGMKLRYDQRGGFFSNFWNRETNLSRDEEDQNDVFAFNEDQKLHLPSRPSHFAYFNFQQGALTGKSTIQNSPRIKTLSPRSLFSRIWGSGHNINKTGGSSAGSPLSVNVVQEDNIYVNRHLKKTITEKRPLAQSDLELLRCIGLDTFVMIRFLRFCFDVTFYPFLIAVMILIPTYYTNIYDGFEKVVGEDLIIETQTDGYFRYTMNRLESGSAKIWVPFGYSVAFVLFILRRHWIEWETFIALRFDFLANGDVENEEKKEIEGSFSFKSRQITANAKDDVQLHLDQYRNSCMVEYIPESHRRDEDLFQFFDAIFPGQVKRAEIILNARKLSELIKQRQIFIERYESVYAKHQHAKQRFHLKKEGVLSESCSIMYCLKCKCVGGGPKKPQDPTMSLSRRYFCCGGKKVKALPYLLSEIKRLNRDVDKEHRSIMQIKNVAEDREEQNVIFDYANRIMRGTTEELTCNTGFVEFENLTAKQSALQCNLTGTNGYMVTESAPDPRDILWENSQVERQFIKSKKMLWDFLLFTGTLFWAGVVSTITVVSDLDQIKDSLPWMPEENSIIYVAMEGYLPVVLLELIMLPVPILLRIIATKFIRFKTHSEIDQFVYKWHFAYRVANLVIIIVRHQVLKTFTKILESPQTTIGTLTAGIATSSQFFLNNMLLAAGTETLFELAQIPRIVSHLILHKLITIEAASKRTIERLKAPVSLEWGDVVPKFIFALLIAAVYTAIVPVVTGTCAVFFYIATKVYTHQALFIYAQPYEGGGKLMYQLNRSVFSIVYTKVNIFSILLALKKQNVTALSFFVIMNILTFLVDKQVTKKFVKPGLTLAFTNARLVDEQNKLDEERSRLYQEYRHAKLAKRRDAAKAAKNLHIKNYKEISSRLLPPRPRMLSSDGADSPPKVKRTRFNMEDAQQQSFKSSNSNRRGDFSDEESMEDDQEFYLYRQPELNKAQWETKPRPYI